MKIGSNRLPIESFLPKTAPGKHIRVRAPVRRRRMRLEYFDADKEPKVGVPKTGFLHQNVILVKESLGSDRKR
jgi:hypothetical protein